MNGPVPIVFLALKSIGNRRFSVAITTVSLALSIVLLLGVERLRIEAREGFANTISGTDLVVGARGSAIQLLLHSVFHIGNPTRSISWQSYQAIREHPLVAWSVPLSLGDSHRGFRVLGTTADFFRHYRYGRKLSLELAEGVVFEDRFDAVLGAEVANALAYALGQSIVLSHGTGEVSFVDHDDHPFQVVGVLEPTGTPLDRTVIVSLQGLDALHAGWGSGRPVGRALAGAGAESSEPPESISAALVGLQSRLGVFRVQRFVNEYREEPLQAALPGATLQELWDTMALAQRALLGVSVLVVLVGLSGMVATLLTSLNERRREMAVLRAVGARPRHIFALLVGEAGAIMAIATSAALALLYLAQLLLQPLVQTHLGLYLPIRPPSPYELTLLGAALAGGVLVGTLPAYLAYRQTLADGLMIRT